MCKEEFKTSNVLHIGNEEFPIYLTLDTNGDLILKCEHEIPAVAYFDILMSSVQEYADKNK